MTPVCTFHVHPYDEEEDVLEIVRSNKLNFKIFYSMTAKYLCPLSEFDNTTKDLKVVTLSTGETGLWTSAGQEAIFDVIAAVICSSLRAPPGYPRFQFPFFPRSIKISGPSDPSFCKAMSAAKNLYNFMAKAVDPDNSSPELFSDDAECFSPSAPTLSAVEDMPEVVPADIPPLDNHAAFHDAIRAANGRFVFCSENEVLFFQDDINANGNIIRHDIRPCWIRPGQVVRVAMALRLRKQPGGFYTTHQHLRSVHLLHDGLTMGVTHGEQGV